MIHGANEWGSHPHPTARWGQKTSLAVKLVQSKDGASHPLMTEESWHTPRTQRPSKQFYSIFGKTTFIRRQLINMPAQKSLSKRAKVICLISAVQGKAVLTFSLMKGMSSAVTLKSIRDYQHFVFEVSRSETLETVAKITSLIKISPTQPLSTRPQDSEYS